MTSEPMPGPPWTPEAIRSLGSVTDAATLGSIFGLSTWRSRQMARTGEWEKVGIQIIKVGSHYRVGVLSILKVVGSGGRPGPGPAPGTPRLSRREQPDGDAVAASHQDRTTGHNPERPTSRPLKTTNSVHGQLPTFQDEFTAADH
jgi:hypothetical protein